MLEQIKTAVPEASQIMLDAENSKINTSEKSGHANFVTEYDSLMQKELFQRLSNILPDAEFLGRKITHHLPLPAKVICLLLIPLTEQRISSAKIIPAVFPSDY